MSDLAMHPVAAVEPPRFVSDRRGFRIGLVTICAVILLTLWSIPAFYDLRASNRFFPSWLHLLAETFSIAVSAMVFAVSWNAQGARRTGSMSLLACGFLAVALLDLAHLLSYRGMPEFITPASPQKAIVFWLCARLVSAATVLWFSFGRGQEPLQQDRRFLQLGIALVGVAAVVFLEVAFPEVWPRFYIEGQGVTPAKVAVEGLVIGLTAIATARLWFIPHEARFDAGGVATAGCLLILTSLALSLYNSVNDIFSLVGHVYKVAGYYFIYRVSFVAGVREPYERLSVEVAERQRAEEALRVYSGRLQSLSRRLMEAEEGEKRRLGRELHDRTGSNLSAMLIGTAVLRSRLPPAAQADLSPLIDHSEMLIRETMQQVREVLADLRPAALDDLGLLSALKHHVHSVFVRGTAKCTVEGDEPVPRLAAMAEISLFRIAQEAITNAIKHGAATRISVSLHAEPGRIVLTVVDDGKGFDLDRRGATASGLGMVTMRERAEAIGATIAIDTSPGHGTRVSVALPSPLRGERNG